ncbi:MAG: aminotransferase class IV [Zymomonas mobilis]|uniref:Probable branched-chain-amino-acid aminotransferase n=1 Tax=Zymomonas mobilis TaxID=542 RepID=A0A542VZT1_ZYMMB|nr:aminotransferase class IV [Zymomonas mobilis]TQL16842.1 4-amino-4-deoxychorismate lyase [Zymomonas mobilis]
MKEPSPSKAGTEPTALIETMRFEPLGGISALEQHLARLENSAKTLGFIYNRHAVRNNLHMACFPLTAPYFIRLVINYNGQIAIEITPPKSVPTQIIECYPLERPCPANDEKLYHALLPRIIKGASSQTDYKNSWLAVDSAGHPTETALGNIFVQRDNQLLTPPLKLGLLPGLLRQTLLSSHRAKEAVLSLQDLKSGFLIGHDLFGLVKAKLLR